MTAPDSHARVVLNVPRGRGCMTFEFKPWPRTPRLFRGVTITEKIDGTNCAVIVDEEGNVGAQSRNRIVTPAADNYGFAAWVEANAEALADFLGVGYHYGEWWGQGIQRKYGMDRKVFSLFNVGRYEGIEELSSGLLRTVPIVSSGPFSADSVPSAMDILRDSGSLASPGFMNPEGIVVYHEDARQVFKVTFGGDLGKWEQVVS